MGRGLGLQQRLALKALRTLDRERGPGWHAPADVVATIEAMTGQGRDRAREHLERVDRLQLADALEKVASGLYLFRETVRVIEARIAERERWQRFHASQRAPNTVRREPRAGEQGNPSRVLAELARRGLVERRAHCGPGSAVRLAGAAV